MSTNINIEPKTLRALAKHSGYKPATIFRMQPSEILELLTEKYSDVKDWDDAKAKEVVNNLVAAPKSTTTPAVTTEKTAEEPAKPTKRRTRRTKAQIAADKAAAEAKAATDGDTNVTTGNKNVTDSVKNSEEKRATPSRKRRKKAAVAIATNTSGVSAEDMAVLQETVLTLQGEVGRLTTALDDITMFLTWFHNVKIDPREPIGHLAEIDWQSCIDDQTK